MNPNVKLNHFNSVGYMLVNLAPDLLTPLREEVAEIQEDFTKAEIHTGMLAGNLVQEYKLFKSKELLNRILHSAVEEYDKYFNYSSRFTANLSSDIPMGIDDLWVNFQRKYEFNPVHTHSGVFSFVIYLQIPFLWGDEAKTGPGRNANKNLAGHFSFIHNNSIGDIQTTSIPVDKSYENTLLLFPASMPHCVYPFYSSDEYRISVAGNMKFLV